MTATVTRAQETRRRHSRLASRGDLVSIATAAALEVGERVQFRGEKQARWRVRARGERYVILTKPFNLPHWSDARCSYTVVDLYHGIRGTDDCVGGLGYESEEQIAEALSKLESDEFQISVRNNVTLSIAGVRS